MNQLFRKYFIKIAAPYRLFGYVSLCLMVFIYHWDLGQWRDIAYIPIVLAMLYIMNQPLQKMAGKYHLGLVTYVAFALDIVAYLIVFYVINFNFILVVLALVGLFYVIMYQQKRTEHVLIYILLCIACLSISHKIDFYEHLRVITPLKFTLYMLLLASFIFSGMFLQSRRVVKLRQQNNTYYEQMMDYVNFSNQISRYAPVQLWQAIMRGESEAKIEYKRKKMTIFFSDVQGFTQLSETLIPEDLAYLLNEYLRHMTQIARQYNGTIDKFMGDGILIFFGDIDSKGLEEDAKACVNMALAMQQQMKILRERWQKMGYPSLHVRMGITTGYCHVGNYGTADRMAYTIVGREANLAARIQSQADIDEVFIADSTYQLVRDEFLCIEKAPVILKGISDLITTWQVKERLGKGVLTNAQQSFDYEYKGFNLLLDFNQIERAKYPEIIETLEKTIQRIQLQQQLTNADNVVELRKTDKIQPILREDSD